MKLVENYTPGGSLLDLDMKISTIVIVAAAWLTAMWVIGFFGAHHKNGRILLRAGYKDGFILYTGAATFSVAMWFASLRPVMRGIASLLAMDIKDSKMMLIALIMTIIIWSVYGLIAYAVSLCGLAVKKILLDNKVENYSVSHECYNHDTHIEC